MPVAVSTTKTWLPVALDFCRHLTIDSKETGVGPLKLYRAQTKVLEEICEGLDRGIRHFLILKARQLGISTVALAIDLLWLSVHDGTQGALITDDEPNREKFRVLLERYINSLPRGLRVGIKAHNRNGLVLNNGSTLDYLVAGKRRGNVTLGQSRALSFVHGTEVGSWGSEEGLASLMASLAERNPNRFYLMESTAHGFNLWFNLWERAQFDKLNKKRIFIGWYDKDIYAFPKGSAAYRHYWTGELDEEEEKLCAEVSERFHTEITPEQIAWHRWKRTEEIPDADLMMQNFPWTPEQAFISSGHTFFPARRLAEDIQAITEQRTPLLGFHYTMGENFLATTMEQVFDIDDADLRIWDQPHPEAVYTVGCDPAYGRSDETNRHAIVVCRCYADRLVQVAEYATSTPETYQLAWVLAHLAGAYRNCWINLEVTGPGFAVMQELRHLRQLLDMGYLQAAGATAGLTDVFSSVKWYLYHRPDQMGSGYVYNWKSNLENKMRILNLLRDSYTLRMFRARSVQLLKEMGKVTQKGSVIGAEGTSNDDLVFASALATVAWADWVRPGLIANGQTFELVDTAEQNAAHAPRATLIGRCVQSFFEQKKDEREQQEEQRAWAGYE